MKAGNCMPDWVDARSIRKKRLSKRARFELDNKNNVDSDRRFYV